jgi:polysaccharide export outer membrane protein
MNPRGKHLRILLAGVFLFAAAAKQSAPQQARPATKDGAATPRTGPSPAATVPSAGLLPDYRIGPGDVLSVDVYKEPEASIPSVMVRPDGYISLPILGEQTAAGMTPLELQKAISERYSGLIRDARVSVHVREVNSQRIYVIGEVRREGAIRLTAPLTVLQALAESGGLTDFAKRKKIYILRMQGGKRIMLPFDYDAVLRGQKAEENIILQSGDTVVVPR